MRICWLKLMEPSITHTALTVGRNTAMSLSEVSTGRREIKDWGPVRELGANWCRPGDEIRYAFSVKFWEGFLPLPSVMCGGSHRPQYYGMFVMT